MEDEKQGGWSFPSGPTKNYLPKLKGKWGENAFLLLGIYCSVQYLISFLKIFLLISFSHAITLNLFKSYFLSFHFLHLSNIYKKKLKLFFLSFLNFPFPLFYPTNKMDPIRAHLVGVIIRKMKNKHEKNAEKVVGDGV